MEPLVWISMNVMEIPALEVLCARILLEVSHANVPAEAQEIRIAMDVLRTTLWILHVAMIIPVRPVRPASRIHIWEPMCASVDRASCEMRPRRNVATWMSAPRTARRLAEKMRCARICPVAMNVIVHPVSMEIPTWAVTSAAAWNANASHHTNLWVVSVFWRDAMMEANARRVRNASQSPVG